MTLLIGPWPVTDGCAHPLRGPLVEVHGAALPNPGGYLPSFGSSGTGGLEGLTFQRLRPGYRQFEIMISEPVAAVVQHSPFADLMEEVKAGFGRTLSHLPAIFGVSRQTLYNWLAGEVPKEQHRAKLVQLSAAARVFFSGGFKPTHASLERTVAEGKSFIELIAAGADGKQVAEKLLRIEQRSAAARSKLDNLLGDRKPPRLEIADMGRPSLAEDA